MKVNILFTLALCVLLSCSSPSVTNHRELSNSSSMDTNIINQDIEVNIPTTKLEEGTCYLDVNHISSFIYIIDDTYCMVGSSITEYSYNPKNNIISRFWKDITSKNENEKGATYYMVLSGYETQKTVGLPSSLSDFVESNIQRPSFSLVKMYKDLNGNFEKSSYNETYLYVPFTSETEKKINNALDVNLDNLKRAMSQHQSFMMPLENKIDILESKGKEKVDALLNNKVEYNYSSIMKTWDNLTNNGLKINNFINKDLILDKKVKELPAILTLYKQLDSDRENLNKILDNEILPILQQ